MIKSHDDLNQEKKRGKKSKKLNIFNCTKNEKEMGITLIALIITVVVLIILAAISINALFGSDGIITNARKAAIMNDFSTFKEQIKTFNAEKELESEDYSVESLTAGRTTLLYNTQGEETEGNIQTVIPSMNDDYAEKFEIIKGELLLYASSQLEYDIAVGMGIQVSPYIIVDGVLMSADVNLGLQTEGGVVTLPERVEVIGNGAFANVEGLKTVIIPGTVKEIGTNAFTNNDEIEQIIVQEGVEVIGAEAFRECTNLKNIDLPESIVSIGVSVFFECRSLESIKIPSQVTAIQSYTFYYCTNLSSVELPDNLQRIGDGVFINCEKLESIKIPANVNYIGGTVFDECDRLANIEIGEGNTKYSYSKDSGILMDIENNNILFISGEVLSKTSTFRIPDGITSFNVKINYSNITKVIIPKGLKTLDRAEIFPTSIMEVEVEAGNTNFVVENDCLYNGDKTELIMCFIKGATVEIAEETRTIKSFSFKQATNIENVTFTNNITTIEGQVFIANSKLQNIYIGASVAYIDPLLLYFSSYNTVTIDEANPKYSIENNELYNKDKTELLGVWHDIQGIYTVKADVVKIGDRAFHSKTQMTEVILPEGLKEIGSSFNYCTSLKEIYIPNSVEKMASDAFNNSTNLQKIRIDKKPNTIEGAPWGAISWDRAVEWLR